LSGSINLALCVYNPGYAQEIHCWRLCTRNSLLTVMHKKFTVDVFVGEKFVPLECTTMPLKISKKSKRQ